MEGAPEEGAPEAVRLRWGHESRAFTMELTSWYKEEKTWAPLCHMTTQQEDGCLRSKQGFSTDTRLASALPLESSLQNSENSLLFQPPCLWHSVRAARMDYGRKQGQSGEGAGPSLQLPVGSRLLRCKCNHLQPAPGGSKFWTLPCTSEKCVSGLTYTSLTWGSCEHVGSLPVSLGGGPVLHS